MNIIPAIDILNGKCVRLYKGDYSKQKIYDEDPVKVAQKFFDNGIKHLHLIDLDGAKAQHIVNANVLSQIKNSTDLLVEFGGGIKSEVDLNNAFSSGADKVIIGSIAAKNPALLHGWINKYGANRIILGADALNNKIAIDGWQKTTSLDVIDFIKSYEKLGIKDVICTDINKDGTLQGCAIDLYKQILNAVPVNLIASGGVSSIKDLGQLKDIGCTSAIVGKAYYEGRISISEMVELC